MKNIIIQLIIGLSFLSVIVIQSERIGKLKAERDDHQQNASTLLSKMQHFRTQDSLNAVKVGILELQMQDFKKYRAEDKALIKNLEIKNRELVNLTTTQSNTIVALKAEVKDSTVIVKRDTVTLRCFDYHDAWVTLSGCINDNTYQGTIEVRDNLKIVERVEYKKFLFFNTNRVKNREINVVSMNPYTKIENVEHIKIK